MAVAWTKTSVSPVAVDFGFDSLKLLQIAPGDPPQMLAAAAVQVPEDIRRDPSARMAFFGDATRQLLADQPFKGRRAICSIPSYQTLVQNLQISTADASDMGAQIDLHLRHRLNVDPSRMVVRCFPSGEIGGDGATKQQVVCIAASRDTVMRYVQIGSGAKLDVVGMHCEPVAILRSFAYLYRRAGEEKRTTCFIDIGAATTKVVIAHGAQMVFAKTIHAASDHFERQYAETRGLEQAVAGQSRRQEEGEIYHQRSVAVATKQRSANLDIATQPPPAMRTGLATLDDTTSPLTVGGDEQDHDCHSSQIDGQASAARKSADPHPYGTDALDCLTDELHLCVRYYRSIFPDRPIEKLVFLGGQARDVTTCQKVARVLRISAQLGDPLARIVRARRAKAPNGVNLREPQPGWAVPIGLCQCEANL